MCIGLNGEWKHFGWRKINPSSRGGCAENTVCPCFPEPFPFFPFLPWKVEIHKREGPLTSALLKNYKLYPLPSRWNCSLKILKINEIFWSLFNVCDFYFFNIFWIHLGCAYKLCSCDSVQVHDTELILYSHDSRSKLNIKEIHNNKHQKRTFLGKSPMWSVKLLWGCNR